MKIENATFLTGLLVGNILAVISMGHVIYIPMAITTGMIFIQTLVVICLGLIIELKDKIANRKKE